MLSVIIKAVNCGRDHDVQLYVFPLQMPGLGLVEKPLKTGRFFDVDVDFKKFYGVYVMSFSFMFYD